jgi:hypothetical protein
MSNRPSKRYLSKSRFKLAVECPTKLFYTGKPEYANIKNEDEFLVMLASFFVMSRVCFQTIRL